MSLYQIRDLRICKANFKSRYVTFERQGQCLFSDCSEIIKAFLCNGPDADSFIFWSSRVFCFDRLELVQRGMSQAVHTRCQDHVA